MDTTAAPRAASPTFDSGASSATGGSVGTPPCTIAILALVGLGLTVPLLGFAAYLAYDTAQFINTAGPDEDTGLAGLGYLLAGVMALPGLLTVLLSGPALALRRRTPRLALGLSIAGLIVSGVATLLSLALWG